MTYSMTDCKEMEKEICSIFPTEQLEYYINGKRGKLYSKIYNLKRLSKQVLQPKEPAQEECHQEYVSESDAKYAVENIRSKGISADDFDIFWIKCSQYRFKQMIESKSTADILHEWPEYTRPSGFQLVRNLNLINM
ncbi:hypothetical protein CVS40_4890 [Lucilia cuprina]|nr:hypothetical protein CVS40_4890 [Lucilia cuprina]